MRFASFQSGGFITVIVVNPLVRKQAKLTSVCSVVHNLQFIKTRYLYTTAHRGVFCQFTFQWIHYCGSNKSTGVVKSTLF